MSIHGKSTHESICQKQAVAKMFQLILHRPPCVWQNYLCLTFLFRLDSSSFVKRHDFFINSLFTVQSVLCLMRWKLQTLIAVFLNGEHFKDYQLTFTENMQQTQWNEHNVSPRSSLRTYRNKIGVSNVMKRFIKEMGRNELFGDWGKGTITSEEARSVGLYRTKYDGWKIQNGWKRFYFFAGMTVSRNMSTQKKHWSRISRITNISDELMPIASNYSEWCLINRTAIEDVRGVVASNLFSFFRIVK